VAIGYPLYLRVLDMVTEEPTGKRRDPTAADEMDAVAVPIAMALFLFIFFLIPLFLRKYVVGGVLLSCIEFKLKKITT
jgi:hypothetical protein